MFHLGGEVFRHGGRYLEMMRWADGAIIGNMTWITAIETKIVFYTLGSFLWG